MSLLNWLVYFPRVRTIPLWIHWMMTRDSYQSRRVSFPKPLKKFDFDFTLSQHLQIVRQKLHHARMILDGTLRTIAAIASHVEATWKVAGDTPTALHNLFLRELRNISYDLHAHRSTATELLDLSADITATVCVLGPQTRCGS